MKILAFYLPQYHEIEENNNWWGKGYTEWTAVRNSKPLYKNHKQPRVPLNNNYYDLSDKTAKTWQWQAELAREYGVYGFCIYHYWFLGKQLLEKPMEILLDHPEIDTRYCVCWANESWTKTWYGCETEILMKQEYGEEKDWIKHFEYLLKFFKDPRYIKIDNKPVINIYRTYEIKNLKDMRACWERLAIENGFTGLYIVAGNTNGLIEKREELIDAFYNFEPVYTLKHKMTQTECILYGLKIYIRKLVNKVFHTKKLERIVNAKSIAKMIRRKDQSTQKPVYKGVFPQWDNTPRRNYKGMVYKYSSPQLFAQMLNYAMKISSKNDFIYINAWNEWGEGAFLEPDEHYGYLYLEALKEALNANNY